jgi:hypothetical protein
MSGKKETADKNKRQHLKKGTAGKSLMFLRWHYPNQVKGKSAALTLSPPARAPH